MSFNPAFPTFPVNDPIRGAINLAGLGSGLFSYIDAGAIETESARLGVRIAGYAGER
jgi:hypothetical protein